MFTSFAIIKFISQSCTIFYIYAHVLNNISKNLILTIPNIFYLNYYNLVVFISNSLICQESLKLITELFMWEVVAVKF